MAIKASEISDLIKQRIEQFETTTEARDEGTVVSVTDGETIAERDLPGLPAFDGMSVTGGRLYVSLADGRILCLGQPGK